MTAQTLILWFGRHSFFFLRHRGKEFLVLGSALLTLCLVVPADAAVDDTPPQALMEQINRPWTGDLDGMVQRHLIRGLVTLSKTNYFLDGATQRGATYELLKQFEKQINKHLEKKHLKVQVVIIPVARNELIPFLVQGRGDISAANLTVTKERLKVVDFAAPLYTEAKELVVTSPSAPALKSLEDLAGKEVYVRRSSSYFESLTRLNKRLKRQGKPPVKVRAADEYLETEDILEMVNADLIPITVADSHLAQFWVQIFEKIKVHSNLALNTGGHIAWAIRKNSPELKKAINAFVKKAKKGTLLGNIILKRYLRNTKWVRNSLGPKEIERFNRTIEFFKKYAGRYGFDWLMIAALAYQESRIDQSKRSPAGAIGVMQLLPSTAAGSPINIPDIQKLEKNIHAGVKYLRYIYDRYLKNENMDPLNKVLFTFASYNAGPNRIVRLRKLTARMGLNPNIWFRNVEIAAAKRIGRETVQYVANIYKYYIAYRHIANTLQEKRKIKETGAK